MTMTDERIERYANELANGNFLLNGGSAEIYAKVVRNGLVAGALGNVYHAMNIGDSKLIEKADRQREFAYRGALGSQSEDKRAARIGIELQDTLDARAGLRVPLTPEERRQLSDAINGQLARSKMMLSSSEGAKKTSAKNIKAPVLRQR
jgi:hypothetical protein